MRIDRVVNTSQPNDSQVKVGCNPGKSCLLRILLSESAHLIWVLRCERVIQERLHTNEVGKTLWYNKINHRLSLDRYIASKWNRKPVTQEIVERTWYPRVTPSNFPRPGRRLDHELYDAKAAHLIFRTARFSCRAFHLPLPRFSLPRRAFHFPTALSFFPSHFSSFLPHFSFSLLRFTWLFCLPPFLEYEKQ